MSDVGENLGMESDAACFDRYSPNGTYWRYGAHAYAGNQSSENDDVNVVGDEVENVAADFEDVRNNDENLHLAGHVGYFAHDDTGNGTRDAVRGKNEADVDVHMGHGFDIVERSGKNNGIFNTGHEGKETDGAER